MRSRRRSPKGGVQAEKQQRYVQLIAQGINNAEACRIVGINRKTGNRWRYGRSIRNSVGERVHYPPVQIEERRPRSSRYLAEEERVTIADLLAVGEGVRAIGRKLGRAASTISREIRRNRDKDGRYRPHHAEQAARARALKPRKRRIACDAVLAGAVCGLLGKRWSPEQVAHELRELFGEPARWLCAESIYQAIYGPEIEVTRPTRRRRRRRRLTGCQRRGRLTAMRMIDERPPQVADRGGPHARRCRGQPATAQDARLATTRRPVPRSDRGLLTREGLRERAVKGAPIRRLAAVAGVIVVLDRSPGARGARTPGPGGKRQRRSRVGNVNGAVNGLRLVDGIARSRTEKGPRVRHGTSSSRAATGPRGSTASYPRADLIHGDLTSMLDRSSRAETGGSCRAPIARSRSEAAVTPGTRGTGSRFRRASQLRSERPLLRR